MSDYLSRALNRHCLNIFVTGEEKLCRITDHKNRLSNLGFCTSRGPVGGGGPVKFVLFGNVDHNKTGLKLVEKKPPSSVTRRRQLRNNCY